MINFNQSNRLFLIYNRYGDKMKIKLFINKKYLEPEVVICNNEKNKEVEDIYTTISQAFNEKLKCYTDGSIEMVSSDLIIRIYSEKQKVYAETKLE